MKKRLLFLCFSLLLSACQTEVRNTDNKKQQSSSSQADEYFSEKSYKKWLNQNNNIVRVKSFEDYLKTNNVYNVIPTYQLLRTASMAQECNQSAFEVPPELYWQNIIKTLTFIKKDVIPEVGKVEAVSSYRNPTLNACANGAKNSAHAQYYAVDLIPAQAMEQKDLFKSICRIHQKYGKDYDIGLGFYSGLRFHIDSRSYRRWGTNGRGKTSPCVDFDLPDSIMDFIDE